MDFILDHSLVITLFVICAYIFLNVYIEYFQRKNKISDRLLMENYVMLDMKKRSRAYFPKMEIDYE